MEQRRYTTERGVTIRVVPIPLLLDKIKEAHPEPDQPTYTEHLAGGATQDVEITEEMAATWAKEDPDTWAEHAEAWAEYQAAVDERMTTLNDLLWRAVMRRSIHFNMPADEAWVEDQRSYGIKVPDGPVEQRAHYVWTEVLGGQRDIIKIMGLASGADLTEEQLAAAEASFRNTLQGATTKPATDKEGGLDAGDEGGAGSGGEGVGSTAV